MNPIRILIVTNEDHEAASIEKQLASLGYPPVGRARGGEEALALAGRLRPDLVLFGNHLEGELDASASAAQWQRKLRLPVLLLADEAGNAFLEKLGSCTGRQRVAQALRASEELSRTTLDMISVGMAQANPQTGRFLRVNAKMCEITGYSAAELLEKSILEITHPDDRTPNWEDIQRVVRGEKTACHIEKRYVRKDGTLAWVSVNMNVLRDEAGQPVRTIAAIEDITAEMRHRQERECTLRLMRLINEPGDIHAMIRSVTAFLRECTGCEAAGVRLKEGDDFPYFETSGFPAAFVEAERTLCARDEQGQPRRDSAGQAMLECMCGNILSGQFDPTLPCFTARGSFWCASTAELAAQTPEAFHPRHNRNRCLGAGYESLALIPLRHGTRTLGLLQLTDRAPGRFTPEAIDFLEKTADQIAIALAQRQTQEALRESEQCLRELIASAREGVIVYNRDFRIQIWNRFMEEISGMPAATVLGHNAVELFPHYRRNKTDKAFARAMSGETVLLTDLPYHIEQTDRQGWVSSVFSPHVNARGEIIGVIAIIREITEHKQAEAERKSLEEQLFQAQKMESVGRLAGGVAHDFNNMLGVIIGNAEMALGQVGPGTPLCHDLEEVINAAQRSASLTRQLLAFARQQPVNPRVLDLNDTIAGMLKMLRRLIGEDINLIWNPGFALWNVRIDPSQLDQILANLAVNARDAITGVGRLTIETANVTLDAARCAALPGAAPGEYARLTVCDTGEGMTPEVRELIFEPFYTTKEQGKGTGLGLATVYGIVKQNKGLIDVTSEPGKGTAFQIFFPRHAGQNDTDPGLEALRKPAGGTETILLVEDAEMLLALCGRIIEQLGYTLLAAPNPRQAMELARSHPGKIDLLVTDMVLPDMNGRELSVLLRQERPAMKCLYMSGYTTEVIACQNNQPEGTHFLQKPFKFDEFANAIRKALGRA